MQVFFFSKSLLKKIEMFSIMKFYFLMLFILDETKNEGKTLSKKKKEKKNKSNNESELL